MVEWSRALGGVPVYLHARRQPVGGAARSGDRVLGRRHPRARARRHLIRCGGHFAGGTVLHWADGADGAGRPADRRHHHGRRGSPNGGLHVQLSRTTSRSAPPAVRADRRGGRAVRVRAVYGGWFGRNILAGGKQAVRYSVRRYLHAISDRGRDLATSRAARGGSRWRSTCAAPAPRRPSARERKANAAARPRRHGGGRAALVVACGDRDPLDCVREWFAPHGWTPFPFQGEVWRAYLAGESGLIHAATGTGKTYAAWMGPVLEWLRRLSRRTGHARSRTRGATAARALDHAAPRARRRHRGRAPRADRGLRACRGPSSRAPATPPPAIRARQRERLPTALVTTPESLSLLLTREDAAALFDHLRARGRGRVARAAGLQARRADRARARPAAPLPAGAPHAGALRHARQSRHRPRRAARPATPDGTPRARAASCAGSCPRRSQVDALIPETMERFPWSGQIGLRLLPEVIRGDRGGRDAPWSSPTPAPPPRSGIRRCSPRGPTGRASSPCTTARSTATRREWVEDGLRDGQAPLRRLHLDARPRRGLHAGRPGAPGRQPQGRRPADPARRPKRAPARAPSAGSPACPPTRSSWWTWPPRATRSQAGRDRGAPPGRAAARSAGPARGHRRARRRLPRRRAARRGADDPRLPRPDRRRVALGARLRHPRRRRAAAPIPSTARSWCEDGVYVVTEPDGRAAAPAVHRHDRERGRDEGAASSAAGRSGSVEENFIARLRPGDRFIFAGRTLEFVRVREHGGLGPEVDQRDDVGACPAGSGARHAALARARRGGPRASWTRRARASSTGRRWQRCGRSWSCRPRGRASRRPTSC